ncbi:4-phosphoerythronate dehydrogenase PdxB [Puteibacter caeruleilacunae]|nr:4-phosphoerythronate dehydrogenase PdxB [Puteibacter caeruleilacunae]
MKIVIDNKIPYIHGALEPFGEVVYLPGSETGKEILKDADAVITRTRTICNEENLEQSRIKFIATATIGFDHIDTAYCKTKGIEWTNAPGCNAASVEQYVTASIFHIAAQKGLQLDQLTLGVVGVGNVGKKVVKMGEVLGMQVLQNDPPRERKEETNQFVDLETIKQEADIITLHVPLTNEGIDKTWHLANTNFFNSLKKCPVFINTCRGEVNETNALKNAIKENKISAAIIDCWEKEPNIDLELLSLVDIATPHIAGYSKDGKANGTMMSVQAISRFFKLGIDNWQPTNVDLPTSTIINVGNCENCSDQAIIGKAILTTYPIEHDDKKLRSSVETFEKQRGDYGIRREYPVFEVTGTIPESAQQKLLALGFKAVTCK